MMVNRNSEKSLFSVPFSFPDQPLSCFQPIGWGEPGKPDGLQVTGFRMLGFFRFSNLRAALPV
ncbi:MAG: hypothetical protein K8F30_05800, partial [Taibaiella sp.]|nr:hypothetical protein [Taibaiella sp.]